MDVTISKIKEEERILKEHNNEDNPNLSKITEFPSTSASSAVANDENRNSQNNKENLTEERVAEEHSNEENPKLSKIAEFPLTSTSSKVTNAEKRNSQNFEDESITISEIVQPNNEENRIVPKIEDAISSYSQDSVDEDASQSETENEIVAHDEYAGSTRNIVVKSSSDVHFGNKTHYQYEGPVTIKQYAPGAADEDERALPIENGGRDNLVFEPETVIQADEECTRRDQNHDFPNVVIVNEEDKHNKTEFSEDSKWLNYIPNKRKLLVICLSIVVTIVVIILIVSLVNKQTYDTLLWREESNLSGKLKIIHRNEWLAEPPDYKLDPLSLPVPNIIIAHTVTESCANRGECTDIVRYIQHYHAKDLGWSDIGYSFLVGGDGYVYEGRGWKTVGAHTFKWNFKSIGIAFIGSFDDNLPPKHQIVAAKMLIELGVKDKYLAQDYKLYGHLQVTNLRSPGEVFFEDIKTWPHWTNRSYIQSIN